MIFRTFGLFKLTFHTPQFPGRSQNCILDDSSDHNQVLATSRLILGKAAGADVLLARQDNFVPGVITYRSNHNHSHSNRNMDDRCHGMTVKGRKKKEREM